MRTQKRERDDMTGHEAREDMMKKIAVSRGKGLNEKQMEGTGTDETKPHSNNLEKPAWCTQGPDKFQSTLNKLWSLRPRGGVPEGCLLLTAAVTSWRVRRLPTCIQ